MHEGWKRGKLIVVCQHAKLGAYEGGCFHTSWCSKAKRVAALREVTPSLL